MSSLCEIVNMSERRWLLSTRFLRAIEESDIGSAIAVLENNFDIDTELIYRKTAIHICVQNGLFKMAEFLIERGCSLSLKTEKGETPLHLAVQNCYVNFVELLLENRADLSNIDLNGRTVLHYACAMKSPRIASLLISAANPYVINLKDCQSLTPLMYACAYGGKDEVEALLEKGAEVNIVSSYGQTPLFYCLHNKLCTCETIDLLLEAGADIDHREDSTATPLLHGCRARLFQPGPARAPAVRQLLLRLVERGCDVTAIDSLGDTALHLAALLRDAGLARALLNRGADPAALNRSGLSPLDGAARHGRCARIVALLADAGARFVAFAGTPLALAVAPSRCRSLAKLCRICIRGCLCGDKQAGAAKLPLPPSLVQFLLFTEYALPPAYSSPTPFRVRC